MTDYTVTFITAAVVALGSGLINVVFFAPIKRKVDQFDKVGDRVKVLEDHRVTLIEEQISAATEARKKIYEELTFIKTHFVHVKSCTDAHKTLAEAINRFLLVTNDLARHDEKITALAECVRDMRELWLGMKTDIDKHLGGTQR